MRHIMRQPFRAVIFDLDGVLADSEPWWNNIDATLLAEYGVTYRGEYHRNVLGISYRLAVEFYKKTFNLSVPAEEMMPCCEKVSLLPLRSWTHSRPEP